MLISKGRLHWELPEPLIIWAAEMFTMLFDLRLKGLMALTMYFTAEQLCRSVRVCGACGWLRSMVHEGRSLCKS